MKEEHKGLVNQLNDGVFLFPFVLVNDKIVGEGVPRIKPIYKALGENGVATQA